MTKLKGFCLALSAFGFLLCQPSLAANHNWEIDSPDTSVHFSIRHLMISNVGGNFGKVTGSAHYDGIHLDKASVEVTIPASSIDTREEKRDEHLRGPEFFDVEKYPVITYRSNRVEVLPSGQFRIYGHLTMHGVTKEVVVYGSSLLTKLAKDERGRARIGASGLATINRKDFGITFDQKLDTGEALVGDEARITIDVQLVQNP